MRCLFLSLLFLFSLLSSGQTPHHPQYYKFRVYLKEKGNSSHSLDNPDTFLSERAIERKKKEKVEIDEADLPISRDFFTLVERAGGKVVAHSKWFNTLVVEVNDSLGIGNIESLSFVDSVKYIWRGNKLAEEEIGRASCRERV